MRLYSGSSTQFIQDTTQNQIADKLTKAFLTNFRYRPSPNEINSWRNSLRALSLLFHHANILDHGVILEYQLPLSSRRLDCIVCGKDDDLEDNAVIIELKQWEKCKYAECDNEVLTWVGGAEREVLHPSVQVGQYKMYLEDTHPAFYDGQVSIKLNACAYLHNYNFNLHDAIFASKFDDVMKMYPLYTADDTETISSYLINNVGKSVKYEINHGWDVLSANSCDRQWGLFNIKLFEHIEKQGYSEEELSSVLSGIQKHDSHWDWFKKSCIYSGLDFFLKCNKTFTPKRPLRASDI